MTGFEGILQVGAVGAVLAFHLWKLLPRLDAVERALNRMTRAQLVDVLSRPTTPPAARREAEDMLRAMRGAKGNGDETGTPVSIAH